MPREQVAGALRISWSHLTAPVEWRGRSRRESHHSGNLSPRPAARLTRIRMTRDEFLRRIAAIRVWSKDGRRAPHKPLLLLWALARVARDEPLVSPISRTSVEKPVRGLLDRFGHPRREPRPQYPFCRLAHDGMWETPGADGLPTTTSGDIHVSALKEHGISGGFLDSVYELLRGEPEVVEIAASLLLAMHFRALPPTSDSRCSGSTSGVGVGSGHNCGTPCHGVVGIQRFAPPC